MEVLLWLFYNFINYFWYSLCPALSAPLAYSMAARFKTEINLYTALILDMLTFTTMITGLYFLKEVQTLTALLAEFSCLSFTRNYILLSTLIIILWGIGLGYLRRPLFLDSQIT